MLRSGRFRHRLLESSFLTEHSGDLFQALNPFIIQWKKGLLQDSEMAAIYILVLSFFRRPADFLGGPHHQFQFPSAMPGVSCAEVVTMLREHVPLKLKDKKILSRLDANTSFVETFCSFSWRSIPLSVPRSLWAWQSRVYPLQLLTSVPSPEQVLDMQSRGYRCVSMLIQKEEIENFVEEGRDVLGFIVHDLIHADHFFADPARAQAQILFSQRLQSVYRLPEIQKILSIDSVFRAEFYYLMSDMNSVPLHLLKTLKAILLGHFKRHRAEDFTTPLCSLRESQFLNLFQVSLSPWTLDNASWEAALRLNTPSSRGPQDAALLDVALNKLS